MDFRPSEEQILLCDSARRLIEQTYGYDVRRKSAREEQGFSISRWQQFTDLGWLGLAVPTEYGGLGGSAIDLALMIEQLGAGLLLEPLVPVAVAVPRLLIASGDARHIKALMPGIIDGTLRPVLAHGEQTAGGVLAFVEASATRLGEGWCLSGAKSLVLGGAAATHYLISARTEGEAGDEAGVSLFCVPADHSALRRIDVELTDDSRAVDLSFEALKLSGDALVGAEGNAFPAIREAIAWLQLGLHAEALGAMERAMMMTRDYVRTRRQFGAEIGSFQAVQHRLADMAMETELARSMLFRLLSVFDGHSPERERTLAAAKVQFAKSGFFVGAQSVQLHGGIGMADDYAIGMYFKHLLLLRNLHGGLGHHLARLATDQRGPANGPHSLENGESYGSK